MAFYDIDDIDLFFNDFAVDGLLLSTTAGSKTIKVIFDSNYQAVNVDTGIVESTFPMATVMTSDVTSLAHSDILEINNVTYYVKAIQPDGNGMTLLELSKD